MKPFEKCPLCGNDLIEKKVEKLLRGGRNTAVIKINAEVCLHCGEHLYSDETVRKFEQIRNMLAQENTNAFEPLGHSYLVNEVALA